MVQNVNENNDNINESTNFFINAQVDDEVIMYNLEAEADKMEKIQKHLGDDAIVENCVGSLESVDAAFYNYSIYNQDIHRRGELVLDGEAFTTGPVKNKTWRSVVEDKA